MARSIYAIAGTKMMARPSWQIAPAPACRNYSRAYLHHLVKSGEILAAMLVSWHNIAFYQNLMQRARIAIESDSYESFHNAFIAQYQNNSQ